MPDSDTFSTTAPRPGSLTPNSVTVRRPGPSITAALLATIRSRLQGRQRTAQAVQGSQHTVLRAEVGVIVLDRDGVIVACLAQGPDEGHPVADRVPGPDGAEVPGHGGCLARPAEVEAPGHRHA